MSVAYRMLGSVTDAEDAVQDGFVRIQAAEEFQPQVEQFARRRLLGRPDVADVHRDLKTAAVHRRATLAEQAAGRGGGRFDGVFGNSEEA